jgi:hypothetical protein
MSKEEIRESIEEVFDEKVRMGLERLRNMEREFFDRKVIRLDKAGEKAEAQIRVLQTEIDNIDIAIKVLESLKVV